MAPDVAALLGAFLPKNLALADGTTLSVEWHDADENFDRPDGLYGTFRLVTTVPLVQGIQHGQQAVGVNATQVFTYATSEDTYQLTERDILTTASITINGTAGGAPRTFVKETDYELAQTPNYWTYDAIRWKPTGTQPDEGTTFTVAYQHRTVDLLIAGHYRLLYRLTLFCNDLPSPFVPKSRVAGQLGDALVSHLMKNQGKNLYGTGEVNIGPVIALGTIAPDAAESLARWTVDLYLHRHAKAVTERAKTIGKAVPVFHAD